MTTAIDIRPDHLKIVQDILSRHLSPDVKVWVFGSRANWTTKDSSDLDLALEGPAKLDRKVRGALEDAFEDSDLPYTVDIVDMSQVSDGFRKIVEAHKIALRSDEDQESENSKWRVLLLNQLGRIVTGKTPSSRNPEYFDGEIPFITPSDFDGRRLIKTTKRYLTSNGVDAVAKAKIPGGAVMVSCIGSDMGKSAIAQQPSVTNQQINSIIIDPEADPIFVYYNLSGRREEIRAAGVGSAVPILNKTDFGHLEIILPPLSEQRDIAHILSALDDKIELNRRMNRTLEEMARAIFKDWFIDFGPTRAKVEGRDPYLPAEVWDLFPDSLVDSELGEIPKGWCAKPLSSYGKIITGKTPSTRNPEFYGEDVPFLKIPDMHGQMYVTETGTMLSEVGADSQPTKDLPSGSVSVSCIATPGLVVLNHRRTHTNQQINSLVPDDQHSSIYLYWHCRQLSDQIFSVGSGGSVFHNMNKSTFSALRILDAGRDIPYSFDKYVSNIHKKILSNENQTHMLKLQRDALLPRLISGDLPIVDH